jgi:uncharacterized membrane protein
MPEQHDPAATFLADQQAAQTEEATREAQSWELNVDASQAATMHTKAHAAHLAARASFWLALSGLVRLLSWAGVGAGVVGGAIAMGWVR